MSNLSKLNVLFVAGINLATIMDAAHVCSQASYLEIREKAIRYIVSQMDRYLLAQRDYRTGCCVRIKHAIAKLCCLVGGRLYGNYLTSAYLAIKVLYFANAVGQLFLLNSFMNNNNFHWYGIEVVGNLIRGKDWSKSPRFPRVTLCDFEIRHSSRVHSYVVQCVLTINLFNEKIFLFLWLWFVLLATITAFSLIQWILRTVVWPWQVRFVKKQVRAFGARHRTSTQVRKFTQLYLRRDGVFLVRLISSNVGELVAAEILTALWDNYGPGRRSVAENPTRKRDAKNTNPSLDASCKNMDVV